jgi:hypothetical protein
MRTPDDLDREASETASPATDREPPAPLRRYLR